MDQKELLDEKTGYKKSPETTYPFKKVLQFFSSQSSFSKNPGSGSGSALKFMRIRNTEKIGYASSSFLCTTVPTYIIPTENDKPKQSGNKYPNMNKIQIG